MAAAVIARRRGWRSIVSISNQVREMSELVPKKVNGRRPILADTLNLVRRLEGQGVPSKQAETLISTITEVLTDSLNEEMKMSKIIQDADFSKFKSEMQSSQEHHFLTLHCEIEKLRLSIEKTHSEIRGEIQKTQSEHREEIQRMQSEIRVGYEVIRGEIQKIQSEHREEIQRMQSENRGEIQNMHSEIRVGFEKIKVDVEKIKMDILKYCIGTAISVTGLGIAAFRMWM